MEPDLGMCPDLESKLQPLDVWDDALSEWATRPGLKILDIGFMDYFQIASFSIPTFTAPK